MLAHSAGEVAWGCGAAVGGVALTQSGRCVRLLLARVHQHEVQHKRAAQAQLPGSPARADYSCCEAVLVSCGYAENSTLGGGVAPLSECCSW